MCSYKHPNLSKSFSVLNLGASSSITSLSGHIKSNPKAAYRNIITGNCDCPFAWTIHNFPNILIFQMGSINKGNKVIPNPVLKMQETLEYSLKSIIQCHSSDVNNTHYSTLATTQDPDIYNKYDYDKPSRLINVCSNDRKVEDDYIFIYQTNVTSKKEKHEHGIYSNSQDNSRW